MSLKKRQKISTWKRKRITHKADQKKKTREKFLQRKTYLLMIPIKRVCLFKQRNFLFQDFEGISGIWGFPMINKNFFFFFLVEKLFWSTPRLCVIRLSNYSFSVFYNFNRWFFSFYLHIVFCGIIKITYKHWALWCNCCVNDGNRLEIKFPTKCSTRFLSSD